MKKIPEPLRKMKLLPICFLFAISVSGCVGPSGLSSSSSNITVGGSYLSSHVGKRVSLTFLQYDCSLLSDGTVNFGTVLLKESALSYDVNHKLTNQEIIDLTKIEKPQIGYVVPPLHGDGYWAFSSFYLEKDHPCLETQLREMVLSENLDIYFGIYG